MDGDRPCDCLRILYLLAMKNMAAPYAAAPQTTPTPMATDDFLTGISLPIAPPMGAPPVTGFDGVGCADPLEPGPEGVIGLSAWMATDGSTKLISWAMLALGLWYIGWAGGS